MSKPCPPGCVIAVTAVRVRRTSALVLCAQQNALRAVRDGDATAARVAMVRGAGGRARGDVGAVVNMPAAVGW